MLSMVAIKVYEEKDVLPDSQNFSNFGSKD